jgi:hypothetical protein
MRLKKFKKRHNIRHLANGAKGIHSQQRLDRHCFGRVLMGEKLGSHSHTRAKRDLTSRRLRCDIRSVLSVSLSKRISSELEALARSTDRTKSDIVKESVSLYPWETEFRETQKKLIGKAERRASSEKKMSLGRCLEGCLEPYCSDIPGHQFSVYESL